MAANRAFPNNVTNPSGLNGSEYADAVKEEGDALWKGIVNLLSSVTGINTITAAATPSLSAAYTDGQLFLMKPASANTNVVTVNIDSRGAKSLRKKDGSVLASGDLSASKFYMFQYVAGSDQFWLTEELLSDINTAAAAAAQPAGVWEVIGDTTLVASPSVTEVVHSYDATRYDLVESLVLGLGTSVVGSPNVLQVKLRNGTSSYINCNWTQSLGTSANDRYSGRIEWVIDINSPTKRGRASMGGYMNGLNVSSFDPGVLTLTPDNFQYSLTGGGAMTAGRLITRGRRFPA